MLEHLPFTSLNWDWAGHVRARVLHSATMKQLAVLLILGLCSLMGSACVPFVPIIQHEEEYQSLPVSPEDWAPVGESREQKA